MSCLRLLLALHLLAAAGLLLLICLMANDALLPVPDLPDVPEVWWGAGPPPAAGAGGESDEVRPFKIAVEDSVLRELKTRLRADLGRLAPPLPGRRFQDGYNTEHLLAVGQHWVERYDWRRHERQLNAVPQYVTNVSGLAVHYMHARAAPRPGQRVVPLLLVHGWPGSVVEFIDLLPLLTATAEGAGVAFEVVAPSIPGYGFSSAPARAGFSAVEAARVFKVLMERLGHGRFYCQGGDWGAIIATSLATLYPDSVAGLHVNMAVVQTPGTILKGLLSLLPGVGGLVLDEDDLSVPFMARPGLVLHETAYIHMQATKPDTVGVALGSSPLGLAAYILEKFATWTDLAALDKEDGGLGSFPGGLDRLITNLMLYWLPNTITTSMRFYKANIVWDDDRLATLGRIPFGGPAAVADFEHEMYRVPPSFLPHKFANLVQYSRLERGGHFAAMQVPHLLAADLISFVNKVEETAAAAASGNRQKSEL